MVPSRLSLRSLARGAGTLALLVGAYNVLYLLGAFGPVACWQSVSGSGTASSNGTETVSTPTVSRECESGIDYILHGVTSGNAQVLFSWSLALLALVALGGYGVWTGRRYLTWGVVVTGTAVSVIGVFSIGWFFLGPTVLFAVAATALSFEARREE